MHQIINKEKLPAGISIELPNLNCGACGYKTCDDFSHALVAEETEIKMCIHYVPEVSGLKMKGNCLDCKTAEGLGEKMNWKDGLKRDFDFILDVMEGEPGPRETILPYNPALVKELGVKKGDVMIGRPMGMSCGCPITHCGVVTAADPRNGVIEWCVTGPLRPEAKGSSISAIISPRAMKESSRRLKTRLSLANVTGSCPAAVCCNGVTAGLSMP